MFDTRKIYDPQDFIERERAKLASHIEEFKSGVISRDVFRALLKCRGFHGPNLEAEYSYHAEGR